MRGLKLLSFYCLHNLTYPKMFEFVLSSPHTSRGGGGCENSFQKNNHSHLCIDTLEILPGFVSDMT
jgi:hypothetical protein